MLYGKIWMLKNEEENTWGTKSQGCPRKILQHQVNQILTWKFTKRYLNVLNSFNTIFPYWTIWCLVLLSDSRKAVQICDSRPYRSRNFSRTKQIFSFVVKIYKFKIQNWVRYLNFFTRRPNSIKGSLPNLSCWTGGSSWTPPRTASTHWWGICWVTRPTHRPAGPRSHCPASPCPEPGRLLQHYHTTISLQGWQIPNNT